MIPKFTLWAIAAVAGGRSEGLGNVQVATRGRTHAATSGAGEDETEVGCRVPPSAESWPTTRTETRCVMPREVTQSANSALRLPTNLPYASLVSFSAASGGLYMQQSLAILIGLPVDVALGVGGTALGVGNAALGVGGPA